MTSPLAPDVRLAGRYVLTERIAEGGMGEVWCARDELLGRSVAVKLLKEHYAADPVFRERFRNEARHTAALAHPNIANVYDVGELGDRPFLVMEYVDGEPLSTVLAREHRLPAERTMDLLAQAAAALQAAHDIGIVHRDVKPANLLVSRDGTVKLTDFGVARAGEGSTLTQTGLLVGTAAYLSPEQAAGQPATPRSDIYALGVVGYECLAGRRPFEGGSPIEVASAHLNAPLPPLPADVPEPAARLVERALAKDPADRPATAAELAAGATAARAGLTASTSTPTPVPQPTLVDTSFATTAPSRARIRPITVVASALLIGVVLAVGLILATGSGSSGDNPSINPTTPSPASTAATLQSATHAPTTGSVASKPKPPAPAPHRHDAKPPKEKPHAH